MISPTKAIRVANACFVVSLLILFFPLTVGALLMDMADNKTWGRVWVAWKWRFFQAIDGGSDGLWGT